MKHAWLTELEQRGLLHQLSSPELAALLGSARVSGYIGFDPTADSLHVGSLLQILMLVRLQRAGHRPIAVVGGATGLIGDPSGKENERTMLTEEQVAANSAGIRAQLARYLDPAGDAALVDNLDWTRDVSLVRFLRDIGKHFSVNAMVARDSVRMRLEAREHGISYTEFSYMLLQAYDYLVLYDRFGCRLQMGGSDQWGNIVSGADLIRRLRGAEAFALTVPLITRSDGKKFGKSEEGNVWLCPQRTSPYQFHQFWLNVDDGEVVKLLKYFTFLPVQQIVDEIEPQVQSAPEKRQAQRVLADEMTRFVHGADALLGAQRVANLLFQKDADYRAFSAAELEEAFRDAPSTPIAASELGTPEANLVNLLARTGVHPSKSRARQDVLDGAVSVNNAVIRDAAYILSQADLLAGGFAVLRKGKKHHHLLRVTS